MVDQSTHWCCFFVDAVLFGGWGALCLKTSPKNSCRSPSSDNLTIYSSIAVLIPFIDEFIFFFSINSHDMVSIRVDGASVGELQQCWRMHSTLRGFWPSRMPQSASLGCD
jgi:hypothetical protein